MLNFDIFLPDEVKKILDKFYKRKEIQKLGADYGLDGKANNVPLEIFYYLDCSFVSTVWHLVWPGHTCILCFLENKT